MEQGKCPRARAWCAGDGLLLPDDWNSSLGAPASLPAADPSQPRSQQLLEEAFDKGILCFK